MAKEDAKKYNRPLSEDEIKRVFKTGYVLSGSAFLFMAGILFLIHNDILDLSPKGMKAETLKGFSMRIEYALRYQTLLVFWLVFNIMATIFGRYKTKALNPLDESSEENVQLFKNILTNSYESIVVSVFSQLVFVSFAQPITIVKYIPMINIVQFIGRVAFFAGYPLQRAFGYQCTLVTNLVMVGYNMYKFLGFVFGVV